jgi:hypothetical protein
MTTSQNESIFIGDGSERIELTGEDKEAFLLERKKQQEFLAKLKSDKLQKEEARISALAKLAALGLTEEEIAAL